MDAMARIMGSSILFANSHVGGHLPGESTLFFWIPARRDAGTFEEEGPLLDTLGHLQHCSTIAKQWRKDKSWRVNLQAMSVPGWLRPHQELQAALLRRPSMDCN